MLDKTLQERVYQKQKTKRIENCDQMKVIKWKEMVLTVTHLRRGTRIPL